MAYLDCFKFNETFYYLFLIRKSLGVVEYYSNCPFLASEAVISLRKRELVVLPIVCLCFLFICFICVLCIFLLVPLVDL